jgi:hypothetical protein
MGELRYRSLGRCVALSSSNAQLLPSALHDSSDEVILLSGRRTFAMPRLLCAGSPQECAARLSCFPKRDLELL